MACLLEKKEKKVNKHVQSDGCTCICERNPRKLYDFHGCFVPFRISSFLIGLGNLPDGFLSKLAIALECCRKHCGRRPKGLCNRKAFHPFSYARCSPSWSYTGNCCPGKKDVTYSCERMPRFIFILINGKKKF